MSEQQNSPVSLGCGTLILIAVIVSIFSNSQSGLDDDFRRLREDVRQLTQEVQALTKEVDDLREVITEQASTQQAE